MKTAKTKKTAALGTFLLLIFVLALTGVYLAPDDITPSTAYAAPELILFDDFDDGDISDWGNWNNIGSVVDYKTPGGYSLKVERELLDGSVYRSLAEPEKISYLSLYVLIDDWDTGNLTIFVTDDSDNQAILVSLSGSNFSVFNGNTGGYAQVGTLTSLDTWYEVEFTNIDWDTQTFDVWFNGTQTATGFGFRGYPNMPTAFQKITFKNPNTYRTAYVDFIQYRDEAIPPTPTPSPTPTPTPTDVVLIDDFNDGVLDGWSNSGINDVVSSPSYEGDYALKVETEGSYGGLYKRIAAPEKINSLSFYVLFDTSNGQLTVFVKDNGNNQAILAAVNSTSLSVFNGFTGSYIKVGTLTDMNTWYQVEFKNINWDTQTFDVWFDGDMYAWGFRFRGYLSLQT